MPARATRVAAYLASLPHAVRREVARVREAINRRLPPGYEEGIRCGIIAWSVPPSIFPNGYPCPVKNPLPMAALAGRKDGLTVALLPHYADPKEWARFEKAWRATGERFDAGACCVRFQKAKDATLRLLVDAVARTPVKRYVACYIGMLKRMGKWDDATPAPRRPAAAKTKRVAARR